MQPGQSATYLKTTAARKISTNQFRSAHTDYILMLLAVYRLDAISQGPKKLSISRAQPPPTCPRNVSAHIKNITHGAV
jgi:hypothetical protein